MAVKYSPGLRQMANQTTDSNGLNDEWARTVWSAGDYAQTAKQYLPMAARLVDGVGIDPDDEVLDIGTGTGNAAITAARVGADVIGIDISEDLLDTARRRTDTIEYSNITFDAGDAAALPYADDTFDVTISNLGHMYADPPDTAARELIRVTRPGGRIGFTSWTPMSLFPRMAGVALQHVPPSALPDFTEPPFLWGDESTVRDRLEGDVSDLTSETLELEYPTVGPTAFWEETKRTSGMFEKMIAPLGEGDTNALDADMRSAIESSFNDSENVMTLAYLQSTATVTKA